MLTGIEVRTRQGTLLTLPLDDVSNGYVVGEIEGLDPVKAILVSSSFAGADGEQYHSARREPRNMTLKLGLEPDYITNTVSDLRQRLYSFFMPKSEVFLRFFMDDGLYVDIVGRVESCQAPLFTKEPAMDVVMMCFQPDFIDPNPVTISGMSTNTETGLIIPYEGTVETGLVFTLRPDRSLNEFTIYHMPADETLRMLEFSAPLVADDVLRISTISGDKGVTLTRANSESSLLYAQSPQSNWLELQQGDNSVRVYVEGAGIPFDIVYKTRYGGL